MDTKWCLFACVVASAWVMAFSARASKERSTNSYRLVCVRGYDAYGRHGGVPARADGDGGYDNHLNYFADVDYSRCTHVVHNNQDYSYYLDAEYDYRPTLSESLKFARKLRATNPNVTQLLAWNGWRSARNNGNFRVTDPEKRSQRLKNLTNILTKFDLDGVDLSWHNSWHSSNWVSMLPKDNFTEVVQALRQELDKNGFLLTATVSGRTDLAEEGYDVPKLNQYLDFINVMGYDLLAYNDTQNTAQHCSPVDSLPGADGSYSVNSAVKYWLDQGADPHKLVLGVSAQGHYFRLKDNNENGPFAPVEWWGTVYPFLRWHNYYVEYPEMCFALQRNPKWTVVRNGIWQAPYASNVDTWVSYDDEVSVAIKMDLVSANDLGGAMIDFYTVDADVFDLCDRKYPLSSVILEKLTGTPAPTRSTETTTSSSTRFECRRGGFFEYPGDCTKYYECVPKGSHYWAIVHDCDEGLGFDARVENCISKSRVRNC